ncbi:hypothetical protein C6501_18810 [Candidatus Poribacteria bacterium]|nr:MAG: hypothetical protein C6501_18810 [Candidatus Poribacteria bacterium]
MRDYKRKGKLTMSEENKKGKFEMVLDLAEFSAKRMEARRSVEFRMFISYMTLLVLAFYRFPTFSFDNTPPEQRWGLFIIAILIHFLYITLQIGIARAMKNDSTKRNYYSKIAESLSGYPINNTSGDEDKNEVDPVKHWFQLCYPRHLKVLWTNWSTMFLVVVPTLSFIIFMVLLWTDLNF